MGMEDSSTEEDSAEKQMRWFYSLPQVTEANEPGNNKISCNSSRFLFHFQDTTGRSRIIGGMDYLKICICVIYFL